MAARLAARAEYLDELRQRYIDEMRPGVVERLGPVLEVIETELRSDKDLAAHPAAWHAAVFEQLIEGRVGEVFRYGDASGRILERFPPLAHDNYWAAIGGYLSQLHHLGYLENVSDVDWRVCADSTHPPGTVDLPPYRPPWDIRYETEIQPLVRRKLAGALSVIEIELPRDRSLTMHPHHFHAKFFSMFIQGCIGRRFRFDEARDAFESHWQYSQWRPGQVVWAYLEHLLKHGWVHYSRETLDRRGVLVLADADHPPGSPGSRSRPMPRPEYPPGQRPMPWGR